MTYNHRTNDPCTDFTYDNLDRLTMAGYGIEDNNEIFTMDDLGNRTNVNQRDGSDEAYSVDNENNRYNSVGGVALEYDDAGNLAEDKDDYTYSYDYENRIVKIEKPNGGGTTTVAEYAYDVLGRRIRKIDSIASSTTVYYYNNNWQVLSEYDGSNNFQRNYVYGNYIDEVLMMTDSGSNDYYYAHDHLFSPAALIDDNGTVVERYEYDAYGDCNVLDAYYSKDADGISDYGNPYFFTGRRLDILDTASLKIMYYRNRYYDPETGRFITHDPLGITPKPPKPNVFEPKQQYRDGLSLYEYVQSNPVNKVDPMGQNYTWIPIYGTICDLRTTFPGQDIEDYSECEPDLWPWRPDDPAYDHDLMRTVGQCKTCVSRLSASFTGPLWSPSIAAFLVSGFGAGASSLMGPWGMGCAACLVIDGVVHQTVNANQYRDIIRTARLAKIVYCLQPGPPPGQRNF